METIFCYIRYCILYTALHCAVYFRVYRIVYCTSYRTVYYSVYYTIYYIVLFTIYYTAVYTVLYTVFSIELYSVPYTVSPTSFCVRHLTALQIMLERNLAKGFSSNIEGDRSLMSEIRYIRRKYSPKPRSLLTKLFKRKVDSALGE